MDGYEVHIDKAVSVGSYANGVRQTVGNGDVILDFVLAADDTKQMRVVSRIRMTPDTLQAVGSVLDTARAQLVQQHLQQTPDGAAPEA